MSMALAQSTIPINLIKTTKSKLEWPTCNEDRVILLPLK